MAIHIELLRGIKHILRNPELQVWTVADRVENAAKEAMFPAAGLAFSPGTAKEVEVNSYLEWLKQFSSFRDAFASVVTNPAQYGNTIAIEFSRAGLQTLKQSTDPAVRYFAHSLDVLPEQSRDVIPCVKWLGPEDFISGLVNTPGGTFLGHIERGRDGLWYITPATAGLVMVEAKAKSQTDARCYLASILSRIATFESEGETARTPSRR